MRLCLTCYHVWPDEAQVCGGCGRSFGGRTCRRRGHMNPKEAQFCVRCGTTELTDATNYLALGWISRVIAWAIAVIALLWLWHHPEFIVRSLFAIIGGLFRNLPRWLNEESAGWLGLLLVIGVFAIATPGKSGGVLRRMMQRAPRMFFRLLTRVFKCCKRAFELLRIIVEGNRHNNHSRNR